MTSLVEIEEIVVAYDPRRPVLQHVSASFDEGRAHVITGTSGCGKSTLHYATGLLLRVRSGAIRIGDVELGRCGDHRRAAARAAHIGFVFQDALLDPSMSVWENTLEGLPLARSRRAHAAAAEGLLDRLGLIALRRQRAATLSGGQAQRVAVARALLKGPTVLLADEPTGNLDDETADVVLGELFDFGRRPGHTTIMVTHDKRVAARADDVLELAAPR